MDPSGLGGGGAVSSLPRQQVHCLTASGPASLAEYQPLASQILDFVEPAQLVQQVAAASRAWHQASEDETLWRQLCRRRWVAKHPTAYTALWLSLSESPPGCPAPSEGVGVGGELGVASSSLRDKEAEAEVGPEVQQEDQDGGAASEGVEEDDGEDDGEESSDEGLSAATWRERYFFAERDARRTSIRLSELSGDYFGRGHARIWDIYRYPSSSTARIEGVFRSDGTYSDTGVFRGAGTAYAIQAIKGESFVRFGPHWEFMFFAQRTEDWGWQLLHPNDQRRPVQPEEQPQRFLPHFLPSGRIADAAWEAHVRGLPPPRGGMFYGAARRFSPQ